MAVPLRCLAKPIITNGSNRSTQTIIALTRSLSQLVEEPSRSHERSGLLHIMIPRAEVG
jgi:hypothetical protein